MKDSFSRNITYLRVSVTDRCNLRCEYCMPAQGVCKLSHRDILSYEEIIEIVRAAAQLGIQKVRITGGEPLIRPGVVSLCSSIAAIDGIRELAVTTNGLLLPSLAQPLRDAGVSRVNVSLDTLDAQRYRAITRGGDVRLVFDGLRAAYAAGLGIKLNCVLLGGINDADIPALAALTRRAPIDVRFIELMPIGPGADYPPEAFLKGSAVLALCPDLQRVAPDGGVAALYRFPDGLGRVGLINPMSCAFCADCNRLRLTSEGAIKPCLHAQEEISVRGLHDDALIAALRQAVAHKPQRHFLSATQPSDAGRDMYTIGG